MSGLAYSADDDCQVLEDQIYHEHTVHVSKRGYLQQGPYTSILSWDVLETLLVGTPYLKEGEHVYAFIATNEGIKIEYAK